MPEAFRSRETIGADRIEHATKDLQSGARAMLLPLEHARRPLGVLVVVFKEGSLDPRVAALWQSAARSLGVALHAADDYERLSQAEIERGQARVRRTYADRLASLGALAGGIAHEINNPVAFIMLAASQIGKAAERGDVTTAAELAREVEDASARIGRIVGELKLFSRIPHGAVTTPIDVNRTIETALTLTSTAVERVATLDVTFGELPLAPGSFAALCPAFVNILLNAAEAAAAPGASHAPRVTVRTASEDGAIVVTIADNGAGMQAETMDRAFEPFFTTKAQGEGAGLGLAIAQDLVQRSGGYIQVTSAPGEGSTFRVVLPVGEVAPDPELPRLLVVDDDPHVGREIGRRLAGRFRVDVATSAEAALTRTRSAAYDVILCDVFMPDRSGPAIHEEVRERSAEQAARFVFTVRAAARREGELWSRARATGVPIVEDVLDDAALDRALGELVAPRVRQAQVP
jgi:signal transduction histidine kinase